VQHIGAVLAAVFSDIFGIQPRRQVRVHLKGAALPLAPDGIGQLEVKLRPIERAFARIDLIGVAGFPDGIFQRRFDLVPGFVRSDSHLGTGGQLDLEAVKTKVPVDRGQQRNEIRAFGFDLLFSAEDMRIILGKPAHPHQPVHGPRAFIAVA